MPFIVVRMRTGGTGEKYIVKSGEGVTWEVSHKALLFNVKDFLIVPFAEV